MTLPVYGRNISMSRNKVKTAYNMIRTEINGLITVVSVNVASGSNTGSSAANSNIKGGVIIGCNPTSNADSVQSIVLNNTTGAITVTLKANATAADSFTVSVLTV